MQLWYSVLGFFSAPIAVVGNGMVIFLITTKRRLHTTANWFILSLAVADFGLGVLFFPRYFVCDDVQELSSGSGRYFAPFLRFFFCASTLSLWALTFDRYIAILKPLRYIALMTIRRVITILTMVWVFAFLLAVTTVIMGHNSTALVMFNRVVGAMLFLCGLFLVVATGHILFINWKHFQQRATVVAQLSYNQPESALVITVNTLKQESSSVKLLTTAGVVVNLLCLIANIAVIWCPPKLLPLHVAASLLLTVNSAVNPVVYALLKRDIRGELKHKFTRERQ